MAGENWDAQPRELSSVLTACVTAFGLDRPIGGSNEKERRRFSMPTVYGKPSA
nr:hypothetical protein Iba_chr12bCG20670 [Ipomoea batatas]GMD66786.1 hypothetical protein Iba_chr12cCG18360 [Ipomoea batatas]GMD68949.1 hypothetical protein Iba_chr12dCG14200 [Ipomoea batatas]